MQEPQITVGLLTLCSRYIKKKKEQTEYKQNTSNRKMNKEIETLTHQQASGISQPFPTRFPGYHIFPHLQLRQSSVLLSPVSYLIASAQAFV